MSQQRGAQVYVGDLPKSADKPFLQTFFEEVGVVKDVVLKERTDRKGNPIAYAFIEYENIESARKAVEELSYTKLDGQPIRVCLADPETNRIRKSGVGNLFIRNLDTAIEVAQLHEAFANFGEIISCKIPTDNGQSRGYGYVQFRLKEDAEQAMTDLKDASINGRPVQIEPYVRRARKNPEDTYTNVYIKNLPESIKTEEDLLALFHQFGETISACLKQGRFGPEQKEGKFGFCSFKEHDDAVKAVAALNGKIEDGVEMTANRAMSREERLKVVAENTEKWKKAQAEKYKGRNLYVRGFDENFTEDDLKQFFGELGVVESVKIPTKMENGAEVSKKFGFVCFESVEDAAKVIKQSPFLEINGKAIYVAHLVPATQRLQEQQKKSQTKPAVQTGAAPVWGPMGAGMPMAMGQMNVMGAMPAQALSGKEMIRADVLERFPGNQELLRAVQALSEDQATALSKDSAVYEEWLKKKQ